MKKKLIKFLPLLILLIFNSCLGLSTDIQMRRNGSGRISMEYRVPGITESIGRLDGNERWPILANGRADWERTVQRLDGIELVSFSSRERANEITTRVTLDFDSMNDLAALLDANGTKMSFSQSGFSILIVDPVSADLNPDLLELTRQVSSGYKFTMSFSGEGNSTLAFVDGTLREIPPPRGCEIVSSGRKVSFSIDTYELLSLTGGFGIRINY